MARKKAEEPHANHERWLVSYADFITLLFAFFVVMFASSQADKTKAQAMSEAVRDAFEKGHFATTVTAIMGGAVDEHGKGNGQMKGPGGAQKPSSDDKTHEVELMPSLDKLSKDLEKEIKEGKIQLNLEPRGLVVTLKEAAFFPSGEDAVMPAAYSSLARIAGVVRELPNPVRLEGHTDSVPIHTARFRSNWELSSARGISIMLLFTERYEIPQKRIAVTGYADTCPVASNETEEGRAKNRRVDILIMSNRAMISMPKAPEAQAVKSAAAKSGKS
jgi:chemotaxis protein MotB